MKNLELRFPRSECKCSLRLDFFPESNIWARSSWKNLIILIWHFSQTFFSVFRIKRRQNYYSLTPVPIASPETFLFVSGRIKASHNDSSGSHARRGPIINSKDNSEVLLIKKALDSRPRITLICWPLLVYFAFASFSLPRILLYIFLKWHLKRRVPKEWTKKSLFLPFLHCTNFFGWWWIAWYCVLINNVRNDKHFSTHGFTYIYKNFEDEKMYIKALAPEKFSCRVHFTFLFISKQFFTVS